MTNQIENRHPLELNLFTKGRQSGLGALPFFQFAVVSWPWTQLIGQPELPFCGDGMYIESDHAFERGTEIGIRFDNPPFKSTPKYYSGTVQWCKPLPREDSIIPFGIGVKFL